MIAKLPSSQVTFHQFLEQYPEDGRYELVDGKIVRILATRQHDDVADFIADIFKAEVKRLNLNYKVSDRIVIATETKDGIIQGRHPDLSVVDRDRWRSERTAYTALQEPIQLAVEVVSANWEDNYIDKLVEYERLGVSEYWIVDYLAQGSRAYLGIPKQASVFVFVLNASKRFEYSRFQADEPIVSPTFPQLVLTMNNILQA
ncbi:Putative restriction endonuclease domain-containing protein [Tumidithrix helvetica PCC 7403]|uniref:Uma2 family endonuclease n=1 Tax=Tumidithrix helvetica TaxID=3457545 RepID=UPI003CAC6673